MVDTHAPLSAYPRGAPLRIGFLNSVAFVMLTVVPAGSLNARAKEVPRIEVDLDSQPLAQALQALAQQTGVQIIFFSQLTEGQNAPATRGKLSLEDALTNLLAESTLTFRVINAETIEIRPMSARAAHRAERERANKVAAVAQPPLEEIVVSATVQGLVAMRTETPLHEIAQSVSIISAEQIRQQNDSELGEVLGHATGITTVRSSSRSETYHSRGFMISTFHLDGGAALLNYAGQALAIHGAPDLAEFDHVEVLRGAEALFAGNANPGGTVNLVRSRPLAVFEANVSARVGSWNQRRAEVNVTGPLAFDGELRGRVGGVFDDRDYFYDTASTRRKKAFGAIALVRENASFTLGGSFQRDDSVPFEGGLPGAPDGTDAHLPRHTALAFDWGRFDTRASDIYAQYEQSFGNGLRLKLNATALDNTSSFAYGNFPAGLDSGRRGTLLLPTAFYSVDPNRQQQLAIDATLTGTFGLFGLATEFAVGADSAQYERTFGYATIETFGSPGANAYTYDASQFPDPRLVEDTGAPSVSLSTSAQSGAFASIKVHFGEDWALTTGARISRNSNTNKVSTTLFGIDYTFRRVVRDADKVTPYVGLMYALNEHYSLYASYSDIYLSNQGMREFNGDLVPPADGVDRELGIKASWRGGALNGSLAFYDIKQHGLSWIDNDRPFDFNSQPNCCYKGVDYNRSKGVDAELSGALAPGWLVGAGYSFNNNQTRAGAPLSSYTPRHLLKMWTSVALHGRAEGLSVGGTLQAQSGYSESSFGCPAFDANNACLVDWVAIEREQKSFAVLDLRAERQIGASWTVAISVNNVFDKVYYETIGIELGNWYGEPRNVLLRVDGRY